MRSNGRRHDGVEALCGGGLVGWALLTLGNRFETRSSRWLWLWGGLSRVAFVVSDVAVCLCCLFTRSLTWEAALASRADRRRAMMAAGVLGG